MFSFIFLTLFIYLLQIFNNLKVWKTVTNKFANYHTNFEIFLYIINLNYIFNLNFIQILLNLKIQYSKKSIKNFNFFLNEFKIHEFCIYVMLLYLLYLNFSSKNINKFEIISIKNISTLIIFAFVSGSVWALKDKIWKFYWNRDPIEWLVIYIFINFFWKIHICKKKNFFFKNFFFLLIIFLLSLFRLKIIKSKHVTFRNIKTVQYSFSKKINYLLIYFYVYYYIYFKKNIKKNKNTFIFFYYLLLISLIYNILKFNKNNFLNILKSLSVFLILKNKKKIIFNKNYIIIHIVIIILYINFLYSINWSLYLRKIKYQKITEIFYDKYIYLKKNYFTKKISYQKNLTIHLFNKIQNNKKLLINNFNYIFLFFLEKSIQIKQ